ncbi:MAG: ABC transporter substrate-binding protein, partial [Gammaproteobacteria bacterium]|nr:ABC transporter substrate-binding protein [Gammaproteobacteria bacterium]
MKQKNLLLLILLAIGLLGLLGSLVARFTFLAEDESKRLYISVMAPAADDITSTDYTLHRGVALYLEQLNNAGGIGGSKVMLTLEKTEQSTEQSRVVAMIGHGPRAMSSAKMPPPGTIQAIINLDSHERPAIPFLSTSVAAVPSVRDNEWQFAMPFSEQDEARFLANYTLNVLGRKLVSIVHDNSPSGIAMANAFEDTCQRFGIRMVYRWSLDSGTGFEPSLQKVTGLLREKKDAGTIFLATGLRSSAHLIKR